MVGRPFGPDHRAKMERQPTDAQEKAERELQRADKEIARLRSENDALNATLKTVHRLVVSYAKRTDLTTRPLAPSVTASQSRYNK